MISDIDRGDVTRNTHRQNLSESNISVASSDGGGRMPEDDCSDPSYATTQQAAEPTV